MIDNVVFFNTWHFGDLHSNKEYVRQFMDEFLRHGIGMKYATAVAGRAVNLPIETCSVYDYPQLVTNPVTFFDANSRVMYINTWVGHYLQMQSHNFYSQKQMWEDISERVLIASDAKIVVAIDNDAMRYVSRIDRELISPVSIPEGRNIMFCNDIPISGQSNTGSMATAINRLASEFTQFNFICTNLFNSESSNIFFTNNLTKRSELICDLPEVGYISESCEIIVTNSSGPGTFAMTRNNFLDDRKSLVAFVIGEGNTFWNGVNGVRAQVSWHPVFDDESIYHIVRGVINEKIFNYSS